MGGVQTLLGLIQMYQIQIVKPKSCDVQHRPISHQQQFYHVKDVSLYSLYSEETLS